MHTSAKFFGSSMDTYSMLFGYDYSSFIGFDYVSNANLSEEQAVALAVVDTTPRANSYFGQTNPTVRSAIRWSSNELIDIPPEGNYPKRKVG